MLAGIRNIVNPKKLLLTRYYHSCESFSFESSADFKNHFVNVTKQIQKNGYAILQFPNTTLTTLREITSLFGSIQQNKNTDNQGITRVANANASQKTAVVKSDLEFFPHTDGSYLSGISSFSGKIYKIVPPKIIILQCIKPSKIGGITTLIDSKRLLSTMIEEDPDLIPILFSPKCAVFTRSQSVLETSVFSPLSNGGYSIRFSFDSDLYLPSWSHHGVVKFYKKYVENKEFIIEKPLASGNILIVDNLRMLHGRTKVSGEREFRRVWIWNEGESCTMVNAPIAPELHYASDDTKQKQFFNAYKSFEPLASHDGAHNSFPLGIHLPEELHCKLLNILQTNSLLKSNKLR